MVAFGLAVINLGLLRYGTRQDFSGLQGVDGIEAWRSKN